MCPKAHSIERVISLKFRVKSLAGKILDLIAGCHRINLFSQNILREKLRYSYDIARISRRDRCDGTKEACEWKGDLCATLEKHTTIANDMGKWQKGEASRSSLSDDLLSCRSLYFMTFRIDFLARCSFSTNANLAASTFANSSRSKESASDCHPPDKGCSFLSIRPTNICLTFHSCAANFAEEQFGQSEAGV
jgi:hypothetical protein